VTDNLKKQLERYTLLTDEKMREYLSDKDIPEDLRSAMSYSVFAGGKRLRPALLLGACEALGGNIEEALPYAAAIEFIHTYSLIHDDLPAMDNDDYRRGRLTSHKVFGEDRAILAGDGLLSYAFEIILSEKKNNAGLYIAKAAGVSGMLAGQWVDVTLNGDVFNEHTMEYIHMNKTAAMIRGALLAGASCADAQKQVISVFDGYGCEIGYTFQIIDDVLDVIGNQEDLGKATGSDKAKNKTTYVTLHGIDGAMEKARAHTNKAVELIAEYDGNGFFTELAKYLLERKN